MVATLLGPDNALNRRALISGATGAVLWGLSACGSDAGQRPAGAGTRKVATDLGEVDVPADPKRVVSADHFPAFSLTDLGLMPIGTCEYSQDNLLPEYRNLLGIDKVGPNGQPNPEKIATLSPDLILSITYRRGLSTMNRCTTSSRRSHRRSFC
nr:ABC transporter substrate-binding protein [Kibdelosporangium sp. MJ126-NF4]